MTIDLITDRSDSCKTWEYPENHWLEKNKSYYQLDEWIDVNSPEPLPPNLIEVEKQERTLQLQLTLKQIGFFPARLNTRDKRNVQSSNEAWRPSSLPE